jgi:DNA sulfur modification protein DndB
MAYLFPAIRGQMGSTTFFQANLKARELAAVAKTAAELDAWQEWSIFERFQRDLAIKRVQQEIVPYLVRTKDRFFGALIVLVYEPDVFEFEPLSGSGLMGGKLYRDVSDRMGFLTIEGGDLVVLDGQHRLAALRGVVTAGDEVQGMYRDDIAEDELCVMFIRHESFEKTRRIFNKVNRYAKPTSPSDNIITSEDDGYAIVARWLVEDKPPLGLTDPKPPLHHHDAIGEPIVEWRSTKLLPYDTKLTTLSALYQSVEAILAANGIKDFDERHRVNRPSDNELMLAYQYAAEWWEAVLTGLKPFSMAVKHPHMIPEYRKYGERWSLLFRPIAQVALFWGLEGAVRRKIPLEQAIERANKIKWSASNPMWVDTIIYANGHMNAKAQGIRLAGRLIAYLIAADKMTDLEVSRLRNDLSDARDYPMKMPKPVVG